MPFTSANKPLFLLIFSSLLLSRATAQEAQVLSPYSAYGLGDIAPGMFAEQRAMGGVSLGVPHTIKTYSQLPSSFANLDHAVFSTSMRAQMVDEEIGDQTFERNYAQFLGLGVGMPVKKGSWGIGFGITPLTDVGYELSTDAELSSGIPVEYVYSGSGGLNQIYGGLAKRVYANVDSLGKVKSKLNLGAQYNYTFGTIGSTRRALLPGNEGFYNTNSTASVIVRGGTFDASAQFHYNFTTRDSVKVDNKRQLRTRNVQLVTGLFYGIPAQIGARRSDLTTTFLQTTLGVELTQDTVSFIDRATGKISMPPTYGFGVGLTWNNQTTISLEVRRQLWSRFDVDVEGWELPEVLADRTTYSLGGAWSPSKFNRLNDNKYFWEQITLYAGMR